MLKGHVFGEQIFGNEMFALFEKTLLGGASGIDASYGDKMEVSYSGSELTISKGACIIEGRILQEDSESTISAPVSDGYARLVLQIDLSQVNTEDSFVQGSYEVITSASNYPTLTQNDLVANPTGLYQFSLCRFKTSARGITDFVDERTYIDFNSIYKRVNQHIQAIDDEKIFLPIGAGCDYYGANLPNENYMWADGSAISRTEYAELFAVIGTTYGAGDGSTTFNLPDKRSRVSVMKDNGSLSTLGAKGGEATHKLNVNELPSHNHTTSNHSHTYNKANNNTGGTTLTIDQMPSHTHKTGGNNAIWVQESGYGHVNTGSSSGANGANVADRTSTPTGGGRAHSHSISSSSTNTGAASITIGNTGGGQAFNVRDPYLVCNYIIRVK